MTDYHSVTKNLYVLIDKLYSGNFNHTTPRSEIPENGIYLFFENGERIVIDGILYNRIVRIGTHRKDGNFPGRIRQHYGNKGNLKGSKKGSVFRLHLGGAIMRKQNPDDPRLPDWLKHMGPNDANIEEEVSRTLRSNFSFICFPVETKEERLILESGLISLLAQYPMATPSPQWLGQHSAQPIIRSTGLWNTQETGKQPLDDYQLARVASYMELFSRGRARIADCDQRHEKKNNY